MKRMSLQWRLTCITTLCIAIICGCLTMFVYKNGVHYIDSLQDAVESQGDEKGNESDEIYISIPDDKWDEFADEFSVQVYNCLLYTSCQTRVATGLRERGLLSTAHMQCGKNGVFDGRCV